MSVNIVDKVTGNLTKVAGNVAPPTDSVTDGDMRPVTSDAVHKLYYGWEYPEERYITLTGQTDETYRQLLIRLQSLIDYSKVSLHTRIGIGAVRYVITQCSPPNRWVYACSVVWGNSNGNTSVRGIVLSDDNGGSAVYVENKYTKQSDNTVKETVTDLGAQSASGKNVYVFY